jgi:hypothetical protein
MDTEFVLVGARHTVTIVHGVCVCTGIFQMMMMMIIMMMNISNGYLAKIDFFSNVKRISAGFDSINKNKQYDRFLTLLLTKIFPIEQFLNSTDRIKICNLCRALAIYIINLRDSVKRFFASDFFHESSSPKPLKITLGSL